MYPLYVISGISGSGKNTLGNVLIDLLVSRDYNLVMFVDEDDFYLAQKPVVKLSNGEIVPCWDDLSAINPNFPCIIRKYLETQPVLLVGFALPVSMLPVRPVVHIHLVIASNPDDLENRCISARIMAKPNINKERDALMVREVVTPFYHQMVMRSDISNLLNVYTETGQRIPIDDLANMAIKMIQRALKLETSHHVIDLDKSYHSQIVYNGKNIIALKCSDIYRRGDKLTLTCDNSNHVYVTICRISMYLPTLPNPLGAYLEKEGLQNVLPKFSSMDNAVKEYHRIISAEVIRKSGLVAIHFTRDKA